METVWIAFLTSVAVALIAALAQWWLTPDYTADIENLRTDLNKTNASLVELQAKMAESHAVLAEAHQAQSRFAELEAFRPKAWIVAGPPPDHFLEVRADRPVQLSRLEYLDMNGAVVAADDHAKVAEPSPRILIKQDLLGRIAQSVRSPSRVNGRIRYRLEFQGHQRSFELPIFLERDYYSKPGDAAHIAYWKASG